MVPVLCMFDPYSLQTMDCCVNISAPSVIEVCSHLTKNSPQMMVSCRQFRRELSTASTGMHIHIRSTQLHKVYPYCIGLWDVQAWQE